jgi:hypothetical protein
MTALPAIGDGFYPFLEKLIGSQGCYGEERTIVVSEQSKRRRTS